MAHYICRAYPAIDLFGSGYRFRDGYCRAVPGVRPRFIVDEYRNLAQAASQIFMSMVSIAIDNRNAHTMSSRDSVCATDIQDT